MIGRIIVPVDASPLSGPVLDRAREFARSLGYGVRVLHVIPDLEMPVIADGLRVRCPARQRMMADAERIVNAALLRLDGVPAEGVKREADGRPIADIIVQEADAQDAHLIVMGLHSRSGLTRLLEGSVAQTVLRLARQPVLLVRDAPADGFHWPWTTGGRTGAPTGHVR